MSLLAFGLDGIVLKDWSLDFRGLGFGGTSGAFSGSGEVWSVDLIAGGPPAWDPHSWLGLADYPSAEGPAQEIMGYNYQQPRLYRGVDFGQPPDGELGHPMLANLGLDLFGGGAPLPVCGLGPPVAIRCRHRSTWGLSPS